MTNLYWPIYRNLESEVLDLSTLIHFDDHQLGVYSVRIAELLIRCAVEIESLSKELYFNNGGKKADDNQLFFDTDCLDYLERKWELSKKHVAVASQNFYFEDAENQILTPLYKANRRGTSSADWAKAYQAVKHNRRKNLRKGNLKHLIRALAALFILNIYFKSDEFDLKDDGTASGFDPRLGSEAFSVKIHVNSNVSSDGAYKKNPDFSNCTYLSRVTDKSTEAMIGLMTDIQDRAKELGNAHYSTILQREIKQLGTLEPEASLKAIQDILTAEKAKVGPRFMKEAVNLEAAQARMKLKAVQYEALINKCQV